MATTKTTQKRVKVKIPLTRTEKDDVWVAINGQSWLIKRGVEVEVPACVAELLENSDKQSADAMEFEAQASANAEQ